MMRAVAVKLGSEPPEWANYDPLVQNWPRLLELLLADRIENGGEGANGPDTGAMIADFQARLHDWAGVERYLTLSPARRGSRPKATARWRPETSPERSRLLRRLMRCGRPIWMSSPCSTTVAAGWASRLGWRDEGRRRDGFWRPAADGWPAMSTSPM